MDDLISRQDAIDAIRNITALKGTFDGKILLIDKAEAQTELMLLPSAQPEIIRCKDCKWFNDIGCAIGIVDDTDKPSENDYCSFAERRTDV